jgi:hypothetical protein
LLYPTECWSGNTVSYFTSFQQLIDHFSGPVKNPGLKGPGFELPPEEVHGL